MLDVEICALRPALCLPSQCADALPYHHGLMICAFLFSLEDAVSGPKTNFTFDSWDRVTFDSMHPKRVRAQTRRLHFFLSFATVKLVSTDALTKRGH